jgi:hypothetical protein
MKKLICTNDGRNYTCDHDTLNPLVSCGACSYLKQYEEQAPQIDGGALRYNAGKRKWDLVHYKSLEPMIEVLEFGALKYAPRNWQKSMNTREILNSMQRHLAALMDGEEVDADSEISHMGHIQANAMFYNYHHERKGEV